MDNDKEKPISIGAWLFLTAIFLVFAVPLAHKMGVGLVDFWKPTICKLVECKPTTTNSEEK